LTITFGNCCSFARLILSLRWVYGLPELPTMYIIISQSIKVDLLVRISLIVWVIWKRYCGERRHCVEREKKGFRPFSIPNPPNNDPYHPHRNYRRQGYRMKGWDRYRRGSYLRGGQLHRKCISCLVDDQFQDRSQGNSWTHVRNRGSLRNVP
jgi:hypothetical protein